MAPLPVHRAKSICCTKACKLVKANNRLAAQILHKCSRIHWPRIGFYKQKIRSLVATEFVIVAVPGLLASLLSKPQIAGVPVSFQVSEANVVELKSSKNPTPIPALLLASVFIGILKMLSVEPVLEKLGLSEVRPVNPVAQSEVALQEKVGISGQQSSQNLYFHEPANQKHLLVSANFAIKFYIFRCGQF